METTPGSQRHQWMHEKNQDRPFDRPLINTLAVSS